MRKILAGYLRLRALHPILVGLGHATGLQGRSDGRSYGFMLSPCHLSRLMCGVGLILLSLYAAPPATAQQIWFAPPSGPRGVPDYMALFRPDAPWQQAASHVQAFEIS